MSELILYSSPSDLPDIHWIENFVEYLVRITGKSEDFFKAIARSVDEIHEKNISNGGQRYPIYTDYCDDCDSAIAALEILKANKHAGKSIEFVNDRKKLAFALIQIANWYITSSMIVEMMKKHSLGI